MKKFQIKFIGRTKGAIGIVYPIVVTVEAEDKQQALLKLYDSYEHIQGPSLITEVEA